MDTDKDGKRDRIYVSVTRPTGEMNVHSIFQISPYSLGGNNAPDHNVDVDLLPQDQGFAETSAWESFSPVGMRNRLEQEKVSIEEAAQARGYASVYADSLGTGRSKGCPSVGDMTETLAAKAVIDWLNGRVKAFDRYGKEVKATWASGNVGMIGLSYNGTLPNMVATTGVQGLKAIIPLAAISSWYDYYRANGLVVGPGGYIGEDADVLGQFIVRRGACSKVIKQIGKDMGREHGDFHKFWQVRDYNSRASGVEAAVFIIHGQSDWNVRQRHAIEWWHALPESTPKRMWLHRGGHTPPQGRSDYEREKWAWFDRYVKGVSNGVENKPLVEVEYSNRVWETQNEWPSEKTAITRFYPSSSGQLSISEAEEIEMTIEDKGRSTSFSRLLANPGAMSRSRLIFRTPKFPKQTLFSGTPKVTLKLAIQNRYAANISVALVEYTSNGSTKIISRGWADPQNHNDLTISELLLQGDAVTMSFAMEPKQVRIAKGSRLGLMLTSTDREHTIRPREGTKISFFLGEETYIDLSLERL